MQLIEFTQKYSSEAQCLEHFRLSREQAGICCDRCQSTNLSWLANSKRWKCKDCKTSLSYKKNTLLEKSKLPLFYWYFAFFLMVHTKKSISAKEVQRQLNHKRYQPIWSMMHKIRSAMGLRDDQYKLEGEVIIDDAFFTAHDYELSHRPKNDTDLISAVNQAINNVLNGVGAPESPAQQAVLSENEAPKTSTNNTSNVNGVIQPTSIQESTDSSKSKRGRGSDKTPVSFMVSKEDKILKNKVKKVLKFTKMKISHSFEAEEASQKTEECVDPNSSITTDKDTKFANLSKVCKEHITYKSEKTNYHHFRVLNLQITNVKSMFKAIYHSISIQYLQQYLDEFCWKLNRRNINNKFDKLFEWAISKEFNILSKSQI